jgi:hypothetical protein
MAERIELPAPDQDAFATGFRPWRTVVLADGSDSLVPLALAAVTQWADPPTVPLACEETKLPAPAVPGYLGVDRS